MKGPVTNPTQLNEIFKLKSKKKCQLVLLTEKTKKLTLLTKKKVPACFINRIFYHVIWKTIETSLLNVKNNNFQGPLINHDFGECRAPGVFQAAKN